MTGNNTSPVVVTALQDLAPETMQHARDRIDAIFWETTITPPTAPGERAAFQDQWLDQYLKLDPELVFVARDSNLETVGYLVGTFANLATSPRFSSLPYARTFAAAVSRYPAHLHINLTQSSRGRGVGGQLLNAFAERVRAAGLPGFHVVTGAASRNVTFYTRENFHEVARSTNARGNTVVFLGRSVA